MNALTPKKLNIKSIVFIAVTAVICLAVCVCLFCLKITPAVALEQEIRCGIKEHTHTDSCYSGDFLTCTETPHSHDGNCYIVLLNENDINNILTLLDSNQNRSLEYVINDVMTTALTYNSNLNTLETTALSQDTVSELNTTISDEESLPDITLNENLNTVSTLALDDTETQNDNGGVSVMSVGDSPNTSNNKANFYIYLDGSWTCIGSCDFTVTTQTQGWRTYYYSRVDTAEMLELINSSLLTDFTYTSFGLSVSSNNSSYSTRNVTIGSSTTTLAYSQNSTTANSAKYVRITQSGTNTALSFYTVKYVYPDGSVVTKYVRSGTAVTLPLGNYEWISGNSTYSAGEAVTITGTTTFTANQLGPITNVSINYDVNFPTVSGITVSTKPTLSGLSVSTVTDKYALDTPATVRNVSSHSVKASVNDNGTGLSRMVQFKGWRVNGTDVILQPNTTLIWEELVNYAVGTSINLTGVWETDPLVTASFFMRLDSVAVDTEGNIGGQDQTHYTNELFATYVGGVDTSLSLTELEKYHLADETSENSYDANTEIRKLYGEKSDGVWLYDFPSDDYIFESLVDYAKTGYLSVDGETVKAEDLNHNEYAIRWYVFKAQSDAWHIDGRLVKKEGLIHVYKTFAGNKELIAEAKKSFYIDAIDVTDGVTTVLNLSNYTSYNSDTDTYMWEITDVDYGEDWEITEHPHITSAVSDEFYIYSEHTVMDAHGDQSKLGTGTTLAVKGMTYALDEGSDEILRAEFTNIYNKSNSIVIKKQDSLTGVSIGGATFSLYQNGQALKFNYNSDTESYQYDQLNGTETVLSGTENGYFEISIEDFSYDQGNIVIKEITSPDGYAPIGNIEIGYTDDQKTIGIISGNSDLIKYVNGILVVGNSTDSMSVTAKKTWDCSQNEWQDVTLQLLANGKLVTTVISGVEPQVILNSDNNWQYTWENLPVYVNGSKIEWSVKETKIGSESAKADGTFVNWLVSYELPISSTDSDGNENVLLTVTNTTKRVMLRLTKTDLGKTVQLSGATFLLEAVDADGNVLSSEISKTASTGDSGTLVFDNLKCDIRYRLTEITAPDGYLKINEYIYFTINEDGSVLVEENYYAEAGNTAYNLTVKNASGVPLPYVRLCINVGFCGRYR